MVNKLKMLKIIGIVVIIIGGICIATSIGLAAGGLHRVYLPKNSSSEINITISEKGKYMLIVESENHEDFNFTLYSPNDTLLYTSSGDDYYMYILNATSTGNYRVHLENPSDKETYVDVVLKNVWILNIIVALIVGGTVTVIIGLICLRIYRYYNKKIMKKGDEYGNSGEIS